MSERTTPLLVLTKARLLEFLREPGAIFWTFGFPILMAVVLGLAFRSQPQESIPVAVLDQGGAQAWVLEALARDPGIEPRLLSSTAAAQALRTGKVELVVEAGSSDPSSSAGTKGRAASDGGVERGEHLRKPMESEDGLSYRFDPTRPQSRTARLRIDDALQRAAGRTDVVPTRQELVSEPGSRYIDFLIPGLIGLNVMGSSMFGLGFAVVMMRTRKLLKRFAATPMRRSDFLLSFMLSRMVFLVAEVALLVAFAWLAFDVAVRGSLYALALVSLIGSLSFTGLAMLIAARPKSIEVASGLMNLVMIPMWLCSGSFFSYSRFPEVLHPLIRALPLTALNDALRSIMNEGTTLMDNRVEVLVTAGWGVLCFLVALRIFRWQ